MITYHDTLYVSASDAVLFLEKQGFHMEVTVPVEVVGNVQEGDGSFFNYKCMPARKGSLFAIIDRAQGREWAFGIQQYHEMDPNVKPLADFFGIKRYRAGKGMIPENRTYWTPAFIVGWLERSETAKKERKTKPAAVRKPSEELQKKPVEAKKPTEASKKPVAAMKKKQAMRKVT